MKNNIKFPAHGKYSKVDSLLFYPAEVTVVANSRMFNKHIYFQ